MIESIPLAHFVEIGLVFSVKKWRFKYKIEKNALHEHWDAQEKKKEWKRRLVRNEDSWPV